MPSASIEYGGCRHAGFSAAQTVHIGQVFTLALSTTTCQVPGEIHFEVYDSLLQSDAALLKPKWVVAMETFLIAVQFISVLGILTDAKDTIPGLKSWPH